MQLFKKLFIKIKNNSIFIQKWLTKPYNKNTMVTRNEKLAEAKMKNCENIKKTTAPRGARALNFFVLKTAFASGL